MKNSNIILYTVGAYGHFINWCCDYFSGNLNTHEIPINDLGNCHGYQEAKLLASPPQFKEFTESDENFPFIQIHEYSFDIEDINDIQQGKTVECLIKNLTYLTTHYNKAIYIHQSDSSKMWINNNAIYKIRVSDWYMFESTDPREYFKKYYSDKTIDGLVSVGDDRLKKQFENLDGIQTKLSRWGHSNINEFEVWELREILSLYYYDKLINGVLSDSVIDKLKLQFPSVYFVRLDDIRDNFKSTLSNIFKYFNLTISNWDNIDKIHNTWLDKQKHIYKDKQITQIVDALITQTDLDWKDWNLTLLDESVVQRKLSDQNIKLKCWNLNCFPTNTEDFLPLLERENNV